ncbi:sucrose operon repressor (scr operon regulatory protein) [Streptococcus pneumoniae]|nr:sucrose operon repressor (scr operon regulatory protein) [Streptococcus pneumoniae]
MMAKESVAMILKMIKREEILEKRIVIPTYFWGDKTTKKFKKRLTINESAVII